MVTPLVAGETYLFTYTIRTMSSGGGVTPSVAGVTLPTITTNGTNTYTNTVIATSTADLVFAPTNSSSRFSIDDVSLKKITSGNLIALGNISAGSVSPTGKLQATVPSTAVTTSVYDGYFENLATNSTTDAINKYGIYATSTGSFTGGAGTATNNYGVYVDTVSGADNNYGAYIAGNVGIGTATPANKLTVNAPVTADAQATTIITPTVASNKGLVIQGYTSQSADLIQAQSSLGALLFQVDASGNLTAKSATFTGTLTMNGHIISGNSSGTTTIAAGANAGTGATASISGNDTSGTITVTTGTSPAAGTLATITFADAYGSATKVILEPQGANGAGLQHYTTPTTTNFTLNSGNAPAASTAYTYSYMVMQ